MLSLYLPEFNAANALFSLYLALFSSIICFDMALNLVPKSQGNLRTLWILLSSLTLSLGTWTANLMGICALMDPTALNFHSPQLLYSMFIMMVSSFIGLWIMIQKRVTFWITGIILSLGNIGMYYFLVVGSRILSISITSIWFLLGVFCCTALFIRGSYLFGKETNDSDDAKDSIRIGCVFGIAVIAAHYISLWGFQRTITDHWHHYVNLGKGMVPFLIVGVSFLLINVFIGNLYQQRLLKEQLRLKYQERYYQPLYELHPDAIIMLDTKGNIIRLNPVAEKIGGMEKENLIGKHFQDFIPTHEQDIIKQKFESVLAGEVIEYEISIYNAIGKTIDIYVKNIPIIVDNKIHGIYGIIKDITEVKKNIEKIEFMAYHAPLTNLPNQRKLSEDVATKIESNIAFSLLLLDLNEFKKTNDRYGHLAGDAVLKEVAKRLVKTSNGGVAYHIGGDEFVVTLPCAETYTIQEIAIAIAKEICLPIRYNKFTLEVYTSIGIARFPSDGHSINELLQKADLAMYASKEKTDNEIVFYNENLLKKVEERFLLEQDLKDALEKKQFQIYFQPQFDLSTGKFRGAEALIRWNHPEKGILQPADFIHVLEETGLIVDVGEWILIEVLKAMQSWIDAGYDFQRISVNISAQHFEKQNLHTFIEDKIKVHSVCLRNLDIEITESALINLEKSIDSVMQLKDLGISISLDDFGTGYSSLNVLRELPIDCLKIDRSFIRNFDSDSKILIEMILNMAKKLNVKVVAEGIETKEQLDFLIAEGCDFGQGYYFSKPLPKEEFVEKWLKR